jgi:hypothetical protein
MKVKQTDKHTGFVLHVSGMISTTPIHTYSVLVPFGGWLFEEWMGTWSSPSSKQLLRDAQQENPEMWTDSFKELLMKKEGPHFWRHVMQTLAHMTNSATTQQHYVTFMLKYKGITRSGHEILAKMGMTSSTSSYDDWEKLKREDAGRLARYTKL